MTLVKYSEAFKRKNNKHYKLNYLNLLINVIMRKGFKVKSYKIVYLFLFKLKLKFKGSIILLLKQIFTKYRIIITLIKKKIAGRLYYLPYFINEQYGEVLLIHWFITSAKDRYENKLVDRLFCEFLDLYFGYGKTIRKIEEFYFLARKNQPFLYFLKKKKFRFNKSLKKYHITNAFLY